MIKRILARQLPDVCGMVGEVVLWEFRSRMNNPSTKVTA